MSVAIEAIVVRGPGPAVESVIVEACNQVFEPTKIRVVMVRDIALVYWELPRRGNIGEHGDQLASLLSTRFGPSLLFRYDSGICFRYSARFEAGRLVKEFKLSDELWVELNELGEPNPSQGVYKLSELKEDVEYETLKNAIQLGLEAVGFTDWKTLLCRISSL